MTPLRIGLIGTGYMGKAHAIGLKAAPTVFSLPRRPVAELICATTAAGAAAKAQALGFNRSTDDWRALIGDPAVDAINISTPPHTHRDMALAAIAAGKPVFCEKPLGLSLADSKTMADAAAAAGVVAMVGYNYIKTPASQLAYEIIRAGEIGEIVHFRGEHVEDYLADPTLPANWRTAQATASPAGALADVGAHIINGALRLAGPIAELVADLKIAIPERPGPDGRPVAVENDDHGHLLVRFASGAIGSLTFSRIARGKKMGYGYEIVGTKGAIGFTQENQNELHLYAAGAQPGRDGFKRLLTAPEHPDYGAFCVGPGHGTGYNDMMAIQLRDFIAAIDTGRAVWPSFADGYAVDRVVAAALASQAERRWVSVAEI